MKFGAHLSIAKGLPAMLDQAESLGIDAVQIFARNPRGRGEVKVTPDQAASFRQELKKRGVTLVIHAPYYVNLGSGVANNQRIAREVAVLDLDKADFIGASYVVVHLGGPGDGFTLERGIDHAVENVQAVLKKTKSKARLLLETSAGGNRVGSRFEELAQILKRVKSKRVGVCLDTCHVFCAGYDVRGRGMTKVIDQFDRIVGLSQLRVVHCNDTESNLGQPLDRHFHIGQGQIGNSGFKALISDSRLADQVFILETPYEGKAKGFKDANKMNLATLKSFLPKAKKV